MKPVSEVA